MIFWRKRKQRVRADLVVGMMFFNPKGEVLLVQKNGKLTIPTGHVEKDEVDLQETVIREGREELKIDLKDVRITGNFGTVLREQVPEKKLIEIFSLRLTQEEVDQVDFEEAGQKGQLWVRPGQIKNLSLIDPLAQEALERYRRRYPGKSGKEKGDKNVSAREISGSIQST